MPRKPPSLHLRNAPIVEMVLDIDCDLGPHFDVVTAAAAIRPRFAQRYPIETKQYAENYLIEQSEQGTQISPSAREVQSVRFHSHDRTQLVQVRASGYSFNRLAPYEGFDALRAEVTDTWTHYRGVVAPLAIRRVSLRYINRIVIPHENRRLDLKQYFRTGPRLPTQGLVSTGFLLQNRAVDSTTGHDVVTVLASEGDLGASPFAFILDVTVSASVVMPTDEDALLWHTLEHLRTLKNAVFRRTVTPQCLLLFR